MSLLKAGERQTLIDMLLRLPNIDDRLNRRLLLAGLPEQMKNSIPSSDTPITALASMVDVADGDAWAELSNGTWSIVVVVENSLQFVRGAKLGVELESLLNTLRERLLKGSQQPAGQPAANPQAATHIPGEQVYRLHAALLSAFPDRDLLGMMVRFKLSENLDAIVEPGSLDVVTYKLIEWAEARGQVERLINGALMQNPGSEQLRAVAETLGFVAKSPAPMVSPPPPTAEPVEDAKLSPKFIDTEQLLVRMGQSEAAVCRIDVSANGTVQGHATGFLVGPSLLMTADFTISHVLDKKDVILRFGYKRAADGTTIHQGEEYPLADDFMVDSDKDLHFALLRVDGSPGDDPVVNQPGAVPRRWLNPKADHTFRQGDSMFMIQHPLADPLKIAYESDAIVGEDASTVTYRISSAPGSAGAPCFTDKWELVAMHHSAGPDGLKHGTTMKAIVGRPAVQAALGT